MDFSGLPYGYLEVSFEAADHLAVDGIMHQKVRNNLQGNGFSCFRFTSQHRTIRVQEL